MSPKAKSAVMRILRAKRKPEEYSREPWMYPAPLSALTAAIRVEPETNSGILYDEISKMWDELCRRPLNDQKKPTP